MFATFPSSEWLAAWLNIEMGTPMRKLLLGITLALPIAFIVSPASAFPGAPPYPLVQGASNADPIEVKGGHGWGHGHGHGRAWGWSRGRKVGWRGHGCPPGLWKQGRC